MNTVKNENSVPAADRIRMTPDEFLKKALMVSCGNLRNSEDNFQNLEIDGLTVENKNLVRTEFHYAKLTNAVFTGVNLEGADFQFAELDNVVFSRCLFKRGGFNFARMNNVRFQDCLLDSSSFSFAAGDAAFERCSMTGTEFHRTGLSIVMNTCDGQCAEFNSCAGLNIQAENCDFIRAEFNDGTFSGAMKQCVFANAEFCGSDCRSLSFSHCRIRDINDTGSCGISAASSDDDDEDDDFNLA
ncbi:MAG: pentapeptide repeat-containing protein [Lentisphaeria bacterium]|nr:pentapeptide repeat-containing protein [Lentisphaeria bacterium]